MGRFALMFLISIFGFLPFLIQKKHIEKAPDSLFGVCVLKNLLTSVFISFLPSFFLLLYSYHHNVTISFSSGITFFIYILFFLLLRVFTSLKVASCITSSIILSNGDFFFTFEFFNILMGNGGSGDVTRDK